MKPLGIGLDPKTGQALLLKKHSMSYLRPCDIIESLELQDSTNSVLAEYLKNKLPEERPGLHSFYYFYHSGVAVVYCVFGVNNRDVCVSPKARCVCV